MMKNKIKKHICRAIVCFAAVVSLVAQAKVTLVMVNNETDKTVDITVTNSRYGKKTQSVFGYEAKSISAFSYASKDLPYELAIESVKIGEVECVSDKGIRLPYKLWVSKWREPSIALTVTNNNSSRSLYGSEYDKSEESEENVCTVILEKKY